VIIFQLVVKEPPIAQVPKRQSETDKQKITPNTQITNQNAFNWENARTKIEGKQNISDKGIVQIVATITDKTTGKTTLEIMDRTGFENYLGKTFGAQAVQQFQAWLQQQMQSKASGNADSGMDALVQLTQNTILVAQVNKDMDIVMSKEAEIAEKYKSAWLEYAATVVGALPALNDADIKALSEKGEIDKGGFNIKTEGDVGKIKVSISKTPS